MVRYCDDMVFIFQRKEDAENFYKVLPKKLNKYELTLHIEKSHLIASGQYEPKKANHRTYFHISRSYGLSESACYRNIRWVEDTLIKDGRFSLPGRKALLKVILTTK